MTTKIFLGTINIASQLQDFSEGFNRLKIPTLTAVRYWSNSLQTNKGIEYCFNENKLPGKFFASIKRRLLYKKAVKECDTFFFIWHSFEKDSSDLRKLKKLGKKIIVFFVGSDVVWNKAQNYDFISVGLEPPQFSPQQLCRVSNLETQISYIRKCEKYADLIITAPALSQLLVRPYLRGRHVIPDKRIHFNGNQRVERPKIVFAPSDSIYKGEEFVLQALNVIKKLGMDFELIILKKEPYESALEIYSDADILIGELFYPGGGKQQREAMAAGCVVLTNNDPRYNTHLPGQAPFVHVDKQNLTEVLRSMINNIDLRLSIAKAGKIYTDQENTPVKACLEIIEALKGKVKLIKPTFYNKKLQLTKEEYGIVKPWDDTIVNNKWFIENQIQFKYRIDK